MIPAVDHLLGLPAVQRLATEYGDRRVRQAIDAEIARLRTSLLDDTAPGVATRDQATALLLERLDAALVASREPSLRTAINATGVILHTNLGRAPLADEALAAMRLVGMGYSTLEFDVATGQRGSRHAHLDAVLREATGADAGLITNNTAAGLTVTLAALAAGREVIISRGELVEIGGGFRVPEVLRGSGALLREVGTTNRTRTADYAAAISHRTAAILRVHPSNFRVDGFTERPEVRELAALAQRFTIPLIEDVGSGWLGFDLFAADAFPAGARSVLASEPAVRASIAAGVDLVAFSGDKLLGGPQAGLIVGDKALVQKIRKHPLKRSLRLDKMTIAALEAWGRRDHDDYRSMVARVRHPDGSWSFDYTMFDRYVELAMDCGITGQINCYSLLTWSGRLYYTDAATGDERFMLCDTTGPEFAEYWAPFLRDFERHLAAKGWLERARLAVDEAPAHMMQAMTELVRANAPRLRISLAGNQAPSHYTGLDLAEFSIILDHASDELLRDIASRKAEGRITTFYVCLDPKRPNTFVRSPPAEAVWIGYYTAVNGYDGFLRWAWTTWPENPLRDSSYWGHPYLHYLPAGDAFLLYPGPRSAVRWELLRDGFEEWEKLRILREAHGGELPPELAALLERFRNPKELGDDETIIRDVQVMRAAVEAAAKEQAIGR